MIGAAGGVLGARAMNLYAHGVRSINHGREAAGAAPGTDRDGRGMQPPQAQHRADQDAAVRIAAAAYRAVSGHHPSRAAQLSIGSAVHYGFGAATGIFYVVASDRVPGLRRCFGTLYGSLVWAIADEGVMSALGLSRGPRELPMGVHAYALCGHWIYGATLEGVRRLGRRMEPAFQAAGGERDFA
jgi:uncharacterized membrane protein YagU involved in acid resistance